VMKDMNVMVSLESRNLLTRRFLRLSFAVVVSFEVCLWLLSDSISLSPSWRGFRCPSSSTQPSNEEGDEQWWQEDDGSLPCWE